MKLTNSTVNKLEPPEKGYTIAWDSALSGFGVRITHTGIKSYIAEARVNGKTRRETVGRHGTLTADQARRQARTKLADMSAGNDPAALRKRRRAESITLAEVAADYKANRRTSTGLPLKASTKADIDKHLGSSFEDWATRPIAAITRDMVARRYADRCGASVAQANQAMRVLRALVNYAAAKYRDESDRPIITDNPVSVLRDASMLRAVKPRNSMIPLDQIGRWWSAVAAMRADPALNKASRSAADLVALLAVTGLRIGEARALQWEQINLEDRSLSLTDTKNRSDITLPLSETAAGILEGRHDRAAWVFPARTGSGHLKDVRGQLELLADQTGVTVTAHDLRRTFRAVAAACNVELWRTKALMNHKQSQDVTLAHYTDLSDVRNLKPEADRIGEHFERQRQIFEADNVVSLEGRRA